MAAETAPCFMDADCLATQSLVCPLASSPSWDERRAARTSRSPIGAKTLPTLNNDVAVLATLLAELKLSVLRRHQPRTLDEICLSTLAPLSK